MSPRPLLTAVVLLLLGTALPALSPPQDLPKMSTGEDEVFARSNVPQPRSRYEEFADRLKLDARTQAPMVQQLFSESLVEAAPIAQKMLVLRQQMVNVSLANTPEDLTPVIDAYAVAAGQMAGIEARAFAKIYATLKPNQQAAGSQAFALMAGMFQPPAGGGRAGQRRGGGL